MTVARRASFLSSLSSPSFSRGLPGVPLGHRAGGHGHGRRRRLYICRHRDLSVGIVVGLLGPDNLDLTFDRPRGHRRRAAFPSIESLRTS